MNTQLDGRKSSYVRKFKEEKRVELGRLISLSLCPFFFFFLGGKIRLGWGNNDNNVKVQSWGQESKKGQALRSCSLLCSNGGLLGLDDEG